MCMRTSNRVFWSPRAACPNLPVVLNNSSADCVTALCSAKQHVPVSEYKSNLRDIVRHVQAAGTASVLLITPPPLHDAVRLQLLQQVLICCSLGSPLASVQAQTCTTCMQCSLTSHALACMCSINATSRVPLTPALAWQDHGPSVSQPERTNDVTGQYAAACRDLGAELGVPVLDAWTHMQKQANWTSRYLSDGLHLTPEGNQALYYALKQLIDDSFPALQCAPLHA